MGGDGSIWSGILTAWGDMTAEARVTLILILFTAATLFFQYQQQAFQNAHMEQVRNIAEGMAASMVAVAKIDRDALDHAIAFREDFGDRLFEYERQRRQLDEALLKALSAGNLQKKP